MLLDTTHNDLTSKIIGAAIAVHRQLGPGLLESAYMPCLLLELSERGLRYETQRAVRLTYRQLVLPVTYRVDLIVEGVVIVELKCVEHLLAVHEAQLITYLRLTGVPVGLLVNFNVAKLTDGVKRKLNVHYRAPNGQ